MNKGRVYGFGDCGCKYETIHREEFENIPLVYVKQTPDANGLFNLEVGKAYKVYVSSYNFELRYKINPMSDFSSVEERSYKLNVTKDAYKSYVMFSLLNVVHNFNVVSYDTLTVTYEVDGKRSTVSITLPYPMANVSDEKVVITGASTCYLYDEHATIQGIKGDKGDRGEAGADIEDLGTFVALDQLKLTLRELPSGVFKGMFLGYTMLVTASEMSEGKAFNIIYGDKIMYLRLSGSTWTEKSLVIGGE